MLKKFNIIKKQLKMPLIKKKFNKIKKKLKMP